MINVIFVSVTCGCAAGTANAGGTGGAVTAGGVAGDTGVAADAGGGSAGSSNTSGAGGGACVTQGAEPALAQQPVDLVLVIDNSGSMLEEAQAVEDNINQNLAALLDAAAVDYRVIVISRHRKMARALSAEAATAICVQAPLSGVPMCPGVGDATIVPAPIFSQHFFQYDIKVESTDSFETLISSYYMPDVNSNPLLAPLGWSEWLRDEAATVFLEVTDDNEAMPVAMFLPLLTALSPAHFGTDPAHPRFVFHSLIGLREKATPTDAYLPSEPIEVNRCTGDSSVVSNAGMTYQDLSIRTGGLRFPICQLTAYDAIFRQLAAHIVAHRQTACTFPIPAPPDGGTPDPTRLALDFSPGSATGSTRFLQVRTPDACQADAFYVDGDRITLCPDACATLNADAGARIRVLFTCQSTILP